jgi:hypothetical protein
MPRPSFWGVVRGLLRMVVWVGLASSPYWLNYVDPASDVSDRYLMLFSVGAFLLLVVNAALDAAPAHARRKRRLEDHREEAAIEHRNLVNEMLNILPPINANLQDAAFMGVIQRALRAILQRVREELDTLDASYLEASLLVFQPRSQIEVVARAVGNRATGTRVDRQATMAFFVARVGRDWKHVPDLRAEGPFAFEGISDPSCPYRSILLIPVMYTFPDGTATSVGVVTIDSARPYEFWNEAVTDRLYKQVMPFVRLIAILLQSHPETVQCQ